MECLIGAAVPRATGQFAAGMHAASTAAAIISMPQVESPSKVAGFICVYMHAHSCIVYMYENWMPLHINDVLYTLCIQIGHNACFDDKQTSYLPPNGSRRLTAPLTINPARFAKRSTIPLSPSGPSPLYIQISHVSFGNICKFMARRSRPPRRTLGLLMASSSQFIYCMF